MMRLRDLAYVIVLGVTAPLWLWRLARTGKWRTDWNGRFGRGEQLPLHDGPRLLLHAVSVGEVNAVRVLVERLATELPHLQVVMASTTDTGVGRARDLFAKQHTVVRYPLDFTGNVQRFLNRVRPDVVALVELEVWPNFLEACDRRGVPVGVVNGRLSQRSFRNYRRLRPLLQSSFRRLAFVGSQSEDYAERFRFMGVDADRVQTTGTMKWDAALEADSVDGAEALARAMGVDRGRLLVVAGSTAPGEHELLHKSVPEGAQLLCAPRRPEWFEQAADALPGCARRSQADCGSDTGRFLLDTIGELRKAYALADVVVIGRSFGNLHGSDMMEPIGLGKPTIVGPAVSDFQDTVDALLDGEGVMQVSAADLPKVLRELLGSPERRARLAANGRAVLQAQRGATERTIAILAEHLSKRGCRS